MKWRFWRRKAKPRYQYRIVICNKGSIFAGEKTAWCDNPDDTSMVAFIQAHRDIPMHDCNFISWEPEFHTRHLMLEERINRG